MSCRGSISAMQVKHGFPPISDSRARVLILGSLPGDESLRRRQYYGHPQNQFWDLLGAVFRQDLPRLDYERKCVFLLRKRIALWDVLEAAERRGSLDAAIRKECPNDLPALFGGLPGLRAVGCNGGKAHQSFDRHFGAWLNEFPGEIGLFSAAFVKPGLCGHVAGRQGSALAAIPGRCARGSVADRLSLNSCEATLMKIEGCVALASYQEHVRSPWRNTDAK